MREICGNVWGTALGAGHICACTRGNHDDTTAHGCQCGNWWGGPTNRE